MKLTRYTAIAILIAVATSFNTYSQSDEFKYQGNLVFNGQPANSSYDFEFRLFSSFAGGTQIGTTQTHKGIQVTNGNFTVSLLFDDGFTGGTRYLDISVRPVGSGAYTALTPRTLVSTTPYAMRSTNAFQSENATNAETAQTAKFAEQAGNAITAGSADFATNATNATNATTAATASNALALGGLAPNQYVLTGDARLSDSRNPLPGSSSYIQNQGAVQQPGSFRISGNAVSGAVAVENGSAFLPSIAFNSDTNTGLYRPEADSIGFATNGTSRVQINSSGNVAIGATSDGSRLRVASDSGSTAISAINTGGGWAVSGDADAIHGSGIGGDFFGGQYGVRSAVFGDATGNHFGVSGFANGVAGTGTYFGVHGSANAPGGFQAIGVYGSATGATNNWAGKFDGRVQTGLLYPSIPIHIGVGHPVCLAIGGANEGALATCQSGLQGMTNIAELTLAGDIAKKLRPVSFNWKVGNSQDIGLIPEEVAEIDPLLVTYNDKGEVEGVKYDRIGVVLINTIKEQQRQIDELKLIVCQLKPDSKVCLKEK